MLRNFFFNRIGDQRGEDCSATREDSDEEPDERASNDRPFRFCPVFQCRPEVRDFLGHQLGLQLFFKIEKDLTDTKESHGQRYEINTLLEHEKPPGEPDGARDGVEAYCTE